MTLPPEQMQKVYAIQASMAQKFKNTPPKGKLIEYLGREFIVYPTVFWPGEDSKALVKNYVINPGEDVLDVCTGSGVIAIHSAERGARRVIATDINPLAVRSARANACKYHLIDQIYCRLSDVFSGIKPEEQFDVVTMNSPFTEHSATKHEERGCWDQDLHVQKTFFAGLDKVLKNHEAARAYIAQSNFGAIESMFQEADKTGFNVREIGKNYVDDLRTFYAFELKRKGEIK